MEVFKELLQIVTGFSLIVLATVGFWHSNSIVPFMVSFVMGLGGVFFVTSRCFTIHELGLCKKWWFIAMVAVFIFLILSFMPFFCTKLSLAKYYCENFWELIRVI